MRQVVRGGIRIFHPDRLTEMFGKVKGEFAHIAFPNELHSATDTDIDIGALRSLRVWLKDGPFFGVSLVLHALTIVPS